MDGNHRLRRQSAALVTVIVTIIALVSAMFVEWGMWRSPFPHVFFYIGFVGMIGEYIVEGGKDNATLHQHLAGQIVCVFVNALAYALLIWIAIRQSKPRRK
jgi:hypothetical protein